MVTDPFDGAVPSGRKLGGGGGGSKVCGRFLTLEKRVSGRRQAYIRCMDDLPARIREHAFRLWEEAGCPEGKAEEFWLIAEQAETGTLQPAETDEPQDPAKFAGF